MALHHPLIIALLALACSFAIATATDPGQLQDFCVAVTNPLNGVFVNGKFCIDPKLVKAEDFFFPSLNKAGNTTNLLGSQVTPVNVNQLPGLNTLGISLDEESSVHQGLSSQNPGVITIANVVFGSNLLISTDVLTKAFQVDKNVINYLQSQF